MTSPFWTLVKMYVQHVWQRAYGQCSAVNLNRIDLHSSGETHMPSTFIRHCTMYKVEKWGQKESTLKSYFSTNVQRKCIKLWEMMYKHPKDNLNIARIANAVQCHSLLSGKQRLSWIQVLNCQHVISVSNVTSLQDRSLKVFSKCIFHCHCHVFSSLWSNVSKVTSL